MVKQKIGDTEQPLAESRSWSNKETSILERLPDRVIWMIAIVLCACLLAFVGSFIVLLFLSPGNSINIQFDFSSLLSLILAGFSIWLSVKFFNMTRRESNEFTRHVYDQLTQTRNEMNAGFTNTLMAFLAKKDDVVATTVDYYDELARKEMSGASDAAEHNKEQEMRVSLEQAKLELAKQGEQIGIDINQISVSPIIVRGIKEYLNCKIVPALKAAFSKPDELGDSEFNSSVIKEINCILPNEQKTDLINFGFLDPSGSALTTKGIMLFHDLLESK